jgi:hypothetical protein
MPLSGGKRPMREKPIVRVHKDDHERVTAYYKLRKLEVELVHDPFVRWPLADPPQPVYDRYSELE